MQVCVLGAGIVGLAAAYELQLRGMQVTVIDRAQPGAGASSGNGAQLSYSYVQPLADAGIWRQLPRLLLSPHSAFRLRPQWDWQQWRWGLEFLRACNRHTSERSSQYLLALAALSRQRLEAMLQAERLDCDFSRTGKLVLYDTPAGLAAARRQMQLQQTWGCKQQAVSAERCLEIEPALQHCQRHIEGAIYTPDECAADCLRVCQGLQALLAERGVRFLLGTTVQGFERQGARISAVKTDAGAVPAQQFVLSLGSASHALARTLGLRLPVYPLKGYSITLDTAAAATPRVNVTDAARKVVFARLGRRLRVAGMAELVGHDARIPPARIQSLCRATRALFPGCSDFAELRPWSGLRPATPTGLPVVGRRSDAPENLLLNTGHGALGFTLAFGTAAQLVELLAPV
ncbi:D-amino acid dehydrogenase [Verminephrobacter aporrectodeae]|uniref:D-amino acid dehydrogenase n=1 Tax=Verminephrobacter aporrectodeae TaxID=1110389 RepID=UPI0002377DCF|nr:D-amino acid dehydrogenase [Verminephrobacter aporrectodeae]